MTRPKQLSVSGLNNLAIWPVMTRKRPVCRKHLRPWCLACFALCILSGCSTQETTSSRVVAEPSRPTNPTLEPTPAESEYSFDKAYRERYGDDFVDNQSEQGNER